MSDDDSKNLTGIDPLQALEEMEENIKTREDLAEFLLVLLEDYKHGNLPEQPLTEYLGGVYGLFDALDSWQENVYPNEPPPDSPDWRWIGRVLHAAFYHS